MKKIPPPPEPPPGRQIHEPGCLGIIGIFLLVMILLISCDTYEFKDDYEEFTFREDASFRVTDYSAVNIFVYEEHEYILYSGYHSAGICHSESCPCKINK